MISATPVGAWSGFVETSEHRRFADFCDACRRYRYIGLCYGVPGVGKMLSARTYAEWALVEPLVFPGAAYVDTVPSAVGECRTLFYPPPVVNSPGRIAGELERLRNLLNWVLGVAQAGPGHAPAAALGGMPRGDAGRRLLLLLHVGRSHRCGTWSFRWSQAVTSRLSGRS